MQEAGAQLRERPTATQRLWVATSDEHDIATLTKALSDTIHAVKPSGLQVRYEYMVEERHPTIFHPAATRAFRTVFAPVDTLRR